MPEGRGFIERQFAFAAHLRDPGGRPAPADVDDRRLAVYRELIYNNVEGFLANTFPVLRRIMPDADWHALVRDFLVHHRCHSPLFLEIPREFLTWLESERGPASVDPPFLWELAHYEWVELALTMAEDPPPAAGIDPDGDLLAASPVLSPLAWPLAYRFPVQRIGPDFQPRTPPDEPTRLMVHRDRDDRVHFLELNAVSARLAGLISEQPAWSGRRMLDTIAHELGHPEPGVVIEGGRGMLEDWRARGIVLGARAA